VKGAEYMIKTRSFSPFFNGSSKLYQKGSYQYRRPFSRKAVDLFEMALQL
jgi:hypothetical protein